METILSYLRQLSISELVGVFECFPKPSLSKLCGVRIT